LGRVARRIQAARALVTSATIETIRHLKYEALCQLCDLSLLDGEFVDTMPSVAVEPVKFGCEVPDAFRADPTARRRVSALRDLL